MSTDTAPPAATADAVLELRQYTLRPHTRDTLIALFDSTFVESQEAVGMSVLGQFRDLDDPERFVWLRGFPDMARRPASLAAFFGVPALAARWEERRVVHGGGRCFSFWESPCV